MPDTLAFTDSSVRHPADDATTETLDGVACLDERVRHGARPVDPLAPGGYLQIQGADRTLLVPLGAEVTHIGRGLAVDLHLDDSSVSRRHAILAPRSPGYRILDDRSLNGTFVNGRRVEQCDLRSGYVIALGRVVLRYLEYGPRIAAAAPSTTSS